MSVVFDSVSYRYPGVPDPAVRDVTLSFPARSVTLVTGPLGAGSSTLLLLASGLAPRITGGHRDGSVSTLSLDPADTRHVGHLAGRVSLLSSTPATQLSGLTLTVREEVAFGPCNLGWERSRVLSAVDDVLRRMDVVHLANRDPATLSGGERQRVLLAACLVVNPEVLLLDEPALELDGESAAEFYTRLPALAETSTVVVATTNVDQVWSYADHIAVLDEGRVVAAGGPEALRAEASLTADATTTVAHVCFAAGLPSPVPLSVEDAQAVVKR